MIFFTGCTHFDHENIIKLANRPFSSVDEMNETMVERWNGMVTDTDVVYHLGDFCWGDPKKWRPRLNGQIRFVLGNHDKRAYLRETRCTVEDVVSKKFGGRHFVLFHYPIEDWERRFSGSIHLHCHTHQPDFRNPLLPPKDVGLACNRFNVGVDASGFAPVPLDRILRSAGL